MADEVYQGSQSLLDVLGEENTPETEEQEIIALLDVLEEVPPIPVDPPQGLQAELGLLYLWNPDAANSLIEQINEAIREVEELVVEGMTIKPYGQLPDSVAMNMPCAYDNCIWTAKQNIAGRPDEFNESQWNKRATFDFGHLINVPPFITLESLSSEAEGLLYDPETGIFSLDDGYLIPTSAKFAQIDSAISEEAQSRANADTALGTRIDNEITRATEAETGLSGRITDESLDRAEADASLSDRITTNSDNISDIEEVLATYGDIVTHNVSEFATAEQGQTADSAIQPGDNISELTNDSNYQSESQVNTSISTHNASTTAHSDIRTTLSGKQNTLTAGANITLSGATISATDTTYSAGNGLTLTGTTFSANVINNTTSDSTTDALSAAAGKSLQSQVDNLLGRGKYLSIWDCTTGLAMDEPPVNPYTVETGSYFIVGKVGTTNYRPNGGTYDKDVPSTTVESDDVKVNDTYFYDGTVWRLLATPEKEVSFSALAGSPYDNTNLAGALNGKQATISDIETIRTNASAGKTASDTIATYGDIVTHDVDEFATSSQGSKADTALQPGDNISELNNDSNYQTGSQVNSSISTHNSSTSAHNDIRTELSGKQATITGGATTITTSNLTASRALVSNASGKVAVSEVTSTELGYLDGVTSNVQTQLNNKQATISDLTTIRNNASAGKTASDTIATYGNIVTHNTSEFATAAQGTKADNALPNTTKYAKSIAYSGSTLTLKDQDGADLSTATIKSSPDLDNKSITTNSDDELQAVGVIDSSDNYTAIKVWTGEHDDLPAVRDQNTIYNVTDDIDGGDDVYTKTEVDGLLESLYPVGSVYLAFNETCPLANLFGTWQKVGTKLLVDINSTAPVVGNGMTLGLTNGTEYYGLGRNGNTGSWLGPYTSAYGQPVTNSGSGLSTGLGPGKFGITTDPTKSGIIADLSSAKTEMTINIFRRTA